jgi:toxin-antitoxin system PIN domain toxin
MRCVDVNVLVYAHRPEAERSDDFRAWLDAARSADEPLALIDQVLAGFVRVVTHHAIFRDPTPLDVALDFVDVLRASPASVRVAPGERHWSIFERLCRATGARDNQVPDAFLAAIAVEHGATWWSADRGFARFADLRWHHPLDEA